MGVRTYSKLAVMCLRKGNALPLQLAAETQATYNIFPVMRLLILALLTLLVAGSPQPAKSAEEQMTYKQQIEK